MNPRVFSVCSGLPQVVHPNPGTAGELGPGTSRPPGTFGSGISPDSGRAGKEPANDHTLSDDDDDDDPRDRSGNATPVGIVYFRIPEQPDRLPLRSQIGSGKNQKS